MRRLALPLLALLAVLGCGGDDRADPAILYRDWRPLLAAEMRRAVVDSPVDLYKFLYQGVMGPAHVVPDAAGAREWLASEWSALPDAGQAARPPLLLPLRPDGRLVRVDLVRLRARLGTAAGDTAEALDRLAAAFALTSREWQGDPELLAGLWAQVRADSALWQGRFDAAELARFEDERAGEWPAVHHSESYQARQAPHYRVLEPRLLPDAWRGRGGRS